MSSVCLHVCVWPCHRRLQTRPHKLHTPAGGLRQPLGGCWAIESRWARMLAIWGWDWGWGALLPPSTRKPPCLRPPVGVGPGADTIANVLQPAWSQRETASASQGTPCSCIHACARRGAGAWVVGFGECRPDEMIFVLRNYNWPQDCVPHRLTLSLGFPSSVLNRVAV